MRVEIGHHWIIYHNSDPYKMWWLDTFNKNVSEASISLSGRYRFYDAEYYYVLGVI